METLVMTEWRTSWGGYWMEKVRWVTTEQLDLKYNDEMKDKLIRKVEEME